MKKNNGLKFSTTKKRLAIYPKGQDVKINVANLTLELKDFKGAIKNELSMTHIATLISLWIIFFTSKFQDFWIIKAEQLSVGFFVVTAVLTFFSIPPFFILLARLFTGINWIKKQFPKFDRWHHKNETEPESKAESIINISQN